MRDCTCWLDSLSPAQKDKRIEELEAEVKNAYEIFDMLINQSEAAEQDGWDMAHKFMWRYKRQQDKPEGY